MVDVMEDQGSYGDRDSGTGSADGQWHHVAVTWASQDGQTNLYLDGRKVCICCAGLGRHGLGWAATTFARDTALHTCIGTAS